MTEKPPEAPGDALSQQLVRQRPELAGRVHYVDGEPWCDGINHTTMCSDEAPAVPPPPAAAALDRESLGRIVHETRLAENAKKDRPFRLEPWDRRSPSQQALDMRIAEAVAAAVQERSEGERAKLAAVEALCREVPARADLAHVTAKRILAIIGGEKESGRG